jgi:hypothetical protein
MSKFDFRKRFPVMTNVVSQNDSVNLYQFNGQDYLVSVFLDNMNDIFEVPNSDLIYIQLIDDMLGFNHTGTVKYKTPNFSSVRFFDKIIEAATDEKCTKLAKGEESSFHFRGSGSEMVHVKLQVMRKNSNSGKLEEKPNDIIMHTYVVTDVVDSGGELSDKKYTLSMLGIERYILEQYKMKDFVAGSSSRYISNDILLNMPDHPVNNDYEDKLNYRADKTGEAIYHIMLLAYKNWSELVGCVIPFTDLLPDIRTSDSTNTQLTGGSVFRQRSLLDLLDKSNGGGTPQAVNYRIEASDQERSVWEFATDKDVKKVPKLPTDFWDFGAPDSCLFTHFGKNATSWDVINKYFKVHTSSITTQALTPDGVHNDKYDPCVLRLERSNSAMSRGKVSLRPLVSYFNSVKLDGNGNYKTMAGAGWLGEFVFDFKDNTNSNFDVVTKILKPVFCDDKPTDNIKNFVFEPVTPSDAALMFKTHAVNYNKGTETVTNVKDGGFENVKEYIGFNYVKPIYHLKEPVNGNYSDLVNIHDDGTSSDKKNVLEFDCPNTPTISAQIASGRNKALKAFIFMNDALSFTTKGIINRTSGMCFSAITENIDKNDKIMNRLSGVYLCSSITHQFNFESNTYTNDMIGVRFFK